MYKTTDGKTHDKEGEYYLSQDKRDCKTDGDAFRVEVSCDECCFHGCLVI